MLSFSLVHFLKLTPIGRNSLMPIGRSSFMQRGSDIAPAYAVSYAKFQYMLRLLRPNMFINNFAALRVHKRNVTHDRSYFRKFHNQNLFLPGPRPYGGRFLRKVGGPFYFTLL